MNRQLFGIIESGQDAFLLKFGNSIDEAVNSRIRMFCRELSRTQECQSGLIEIVPAYCSVTVYFNPLVLSRKNIKDVISQAAEKCGSNASDDTAETHVIPVCYEGGFAPDMENVSNYTHLTKEQIISLHCAQPYLIYMLGFLPGFAYLGGLDKRLHTPRLKTPRTKIPAGSVAIGGEQTGIYPVDSPGGWQIIGRTPVKVFDPERSPQILFKAGDRIQFKPVTEDEFLRYNSEKTSLPECASPSAYLQKPRVVQSGIKIISGGMMTTVQDCGRTGYQKDGVGVSGGMDRISYAAANCIAGNLPGTAVLETTLSGPELQFTLPADFVITGATVAATLDSKPVPMYARIHADAGSVLRTGFVSAGLRSYISFTGGILVPEILGSCSTNTKCGLGGFCGRNLKGGDELAIGRVPGLYEARPYADALNLTPIRGDASYAPYAILKKLTTVRCTSDSPVVLHVLPGPQIRSFPDESVKTFTDSIFTITADCDRMGCRLNGPQIQCRGSTDIISDAVPCGSVQITSSGNPVVMTADRQTTGGYAKIAVVTAVDMPYIAQAVPGTKIKFDFVTYEEADAALKEQELLLAMLDEAVIDI